MKKITVVFIILTAFLSAQVNIGVKNDIFVSTNAVIDNPTASLQNPNPWEINLVSFDVSVNNNYAFLSKKNLLGLISNADIKVNGNQSQDNLPQGTIGFGDEKMFNYNYQVDVLGPAVSLKFKINDSDFGAGFYTRLRAFGNSFDVENQHKYPNYLDQNSFVRFYQPFTINHVTLQENSFFLAKSFRPNNYTDFMVGVTLKNSKIWDALFLRENDNFEINYDKPTEMLTFSNYNIDAFVTTSYDFDKKKYQPKNNGNAFGGDIGFSYVNYGNYDKDFGEYYYKFGLSVTDIGFINVKGEKHLYKNVPFSMSKFVKFHNTDNVYNLMQELSTHVYGNPTQSLVADEFKIALPTALHFNFSGNLTNNNYLSLGLTQRIPLSKDSFKTTNVVYANFAKAKQTATFAAQLSLYEYKRLQFGGYVRWGPFFMGSDNILPIFFRQNKLDSFDFYMGFKIYPFWDNAFDRHRRQKCNCAK